MYYTSVTLEHWGKYMGYTRTVCAPSRSRRLLLNTPLWWLEKSPLSLTPGKKVQCSQCFRLCLFSLLSFFFRLFFLFVDLEARDGWTVVSSLTLHSGRSYPGTPEQPGSRTGTHPAWEEHNRQSINVLYWYFGICNYAFSFNWSVSFFDLQLPSFTILTPLLCFYFVIVPHHIYLLQCNLIHLSYLLTIAMILFCKSCLTSWCHTYNITI